MTGMKIHVAVRHLGQRTLRREFVHSTRLEFEKRAGNDGEPRSIEHEERVRVEAARRA